MIRAAFAPLAGLPSWEVVGEYGSYLRFQFGNPRIVLIEPLEALRYERLTYAEGQYELWIEMCDWVVFQDGARLAHNESERDEIRRAAATLQGQKLMGFSIQTKPAACEFTFDLGGRLALRRYDPLDATHELWHLSTHHDKDFVEIVSFTAAGCLSVFEKKGKFETNTEYPCEDGWIAIQNPAAPNAAPMGLGI